MSSSDATLFLTADDFGDNTEVNAAVARAYSDGVLRFASLMPLRPAAREAAELARDLPGLGVGLHLELCADRPAAAGFRYAFDPRVRAGLEGEVRRQIEALMALGVRPTHLDGHINVHVHPVIFPVLLRLCAEYGIPRLRLPGGEFAAGGGFAGDDSPLSRAALAATFAVMGRWVAPSSGTVQCIRAWGLLRSGRMTVEYVTRLIRNLPPGRTEIYFHPSNDPATAVDRTPTATHQTWSDLQTLLSPEIRRAIAESGARLAEAAEIKSSL